MISVIDSFKKQNKGLIVIIRFEELNTIYLTDSGELVWEKVFKALDSLSSFLWVLHRKRLIKNIIKDVVMKKRKIWKSNLKKGELFKLINSYNFVKIYVCINFSNFKSVILLLTKMKFFF